MNIFGTYVRRNLKCNRLRTIMTVIGITLSMALVTAVIEGGYSGLIYMRNVISETFGSYHGFLSNMSPESLKDLRENSDTESVIVYKTLGWPP